jgi:hypothetical protein
MRICGAIDSTIAITHRELLAPLKQLLPAAASVIFLGDGECDGKQLQADLPEYRSEYVCRTVSHILVTRYGSHFQVTDLGSAQGQNVVLTPAWRTATQYGPISLLAIWAAQYKEPNLSGDEYSRLGSGSGDVPIASA